MRLQVGWRSLQTEAATIADAEGRSDVGLSSHAADPVRNRERAGDEMTPN
jgi:hypothetical protein